MNNELFYILLADDDEGDQLIFKEAFKELIIRTDVRALNNGIQLMEWLNIEQIHLPDLIFLDLNMPPKNGLECLKEIRSNERLKDIFVAIYSTSDYDKDVEETFNNGANIYIKKPNDFKLLKLILEKAVMTAYQYKDLTMRLENFILKL